MHNLIWLFLLVFSLFIHRYIKKWSRQTREELYKRLIWRRLKSIPFSNTKTFSTVRSTLHCCVWSNTVENVLFFYDWVIISILYKHLIKLNCDTVLCKHFTHIRASSYEPGNRAGSVTGTNSVVCSYGKFQPGRPGWIQETQPKLWNINLYCSRLS